MTHLEWGQADRATFAVDHHVSFNRVQIQNGGVARPLGLHERITKARHQCGLRGAVGPNRHAFAHVVNDHPQIIDAMHMVRVAVGIDHRVQRADARIQELAAHIG